MDSDYKGSERLYSLHPGDIIEYYDWATMHSSLKIIKATVSSINDSCFGDDKFVVTTSKSLFHPLDIEHNDRFRMVSSKYKDAPLRGQWTSLKEVNLIKGNWVIPRSKENMRKQINVTPGGKDVEAIAALAYASNKSKDRPIADPIDEGTKPKKAKINTEENLYKNEKEEKKRKNQEYYKKTNNASKKK